MDSNLIERLNESDLFLRDRANAKPAPLNEYDISLMLDAAKSCHEAAELLDRAIIPPCKLDDEVWLVVTRKEIPKFYENDYIYGIRAVECPFESECSYDECKDEQLSVVCGVVTGFFFGFRCNGDWLIFIDDVYQRNSSDIGKTIFFTKEEAEKALRGEGE